MLKVTMLASEELDRPVRLNAGALALLIRASAAGSAESQKALTEVIDRLSDTEESPRWSKRLRESLLRCGKSLGDGSLLKSFDPDERRAVTCIVEVALRQIDAAAKGTVVKISYHPRGIAGPEADLTSEEVTGRSKPTRRRDLSADEKKARAAAKRAGKAARL